MPFSATRGVLTGLGLSIQPGHGVYVPLAHRYVGAPKQPPLAEIQRIFQPIFDDPSIQKVAHDLKHADVDNVWVQFYPTLRARREMPR